MIRRRRRLEPDRRTLVLGGLATAALAAVVALEVGAYGGGDRPLPQDTDDVLGAAEEPPWSRRRRWREPATARRRPARTPLLQPAELVCRHLPRRPRTTYLLRTRRRFGPFRNLVVGRRHIRHFVPGIALGFAAGAVAIVSRDESLEPMLAVPFGIGMGLTTDESALLLELEDVYWTQEGLLSVQITLSVIAVLASLALGLRFLRRGEHVVLGTLDTPRDACEFGRGAAALPGPPTRSKGPGKWQTNPPRAGIPIPIRPGSGATGTARSGPAHR